MTVTSPGREGFSSLRSGGLNWDSFPLRLFTKGNAKFWNPTDLDFSQDARDWQELTSEQQRSATFLCAQFIAGEEAVTEDIQPFMKAMSTEGRFGDEMYLTQFCFEEAKHTQVFRLWMDEVGLTSDLHSYVADNPYYRQLFYEELPSSLRILETDPSPVNQVRASVTYNHVIEAVVGWRVSTPGSKFVRPAGSCLAFRNWCEMKGTTNDGTWLGERSPAEGTSPPTITTGTSSSSGWVNSCPWPSE